MNINTYFYDGTNVAGGIVNSKGRLTKVASSVSTTEYLAFDILGRVTRSKQTTDGVEYGGGTDPTKWMTYTYNLSGTLIEQQYPSGRVVRNTLDTDGSLQQVQSRRGNDTFRNYANAFNYTAAGAVSSMRLGNGRWENTAFNSRLQPTQIGLGGSATNTSLLKLNYDYGSTDNNGNVKSQMITVPTVGSNPGFVATQNYTYDSLNRLKSAIENIAGQTPPSWKQTYTFDRYGNRRFDPANTTTIPAGCLEAVCNPQIDANTNKLIGYQFDNAGNTRTDANGQVFTYDAENMQVKVQNGSTTIGEYFYDGDGKRIKKIVSATGETTIFVYDLTGRTVAEYSTIVAPSQEAKASYLTNDHLGSPRITSDAIGLVISRRDFRPYGEEISRTNYSNDSIRQKFTTYERDTETNLDFAQARTFGSNLGRFTSPDPVGGAISDPQTLNKYSYVVNNPLAYVDPSGLCGTTAGSPDDSPCIWLRYQLEGGGYSYQSVSQTQYSDRSRFEGWEQIDPASVEPFRLAGLHKEYADDEEYQGFLRGGTLVGLGPNGRFIRRAPPDLPLIAPDDPDSLISKVETREASFDRENTPIEQSVYWQAGLGPVSFQRTHQGNRNFATFGIGLSWPAFSIQTGRLASTERMSSGITPLSVSFGAVAVVNGHYTLNVDEPPMSRTRPPVISVVDSTGIGSPQISIGPSITIPTNGRMRFRVRAADMYRNPIQ